MSRTKKGSKLFWEEYTSRRPIGNYGYPSFRGNTPQSDKRRTKRIERQQGKLECLNTLYKEKDDMEEQLKFRILRRTSYDSNGCDCCEPTECDNYTIEVNGEVLYFPLHEHDDPRYPQEMQFISVEEALEYILKNYTSLYVEVDYA